MIYFDIAISAGCLYFIIRSLRSPDKHNTIVALYFTLVPLLGMMIADGPAPRK